MLFKFLKFAPKNGLAFDVSFGNKSGHSLILARAFYEVGQKYVNFNYFNAFSRLLPFISTSSTRTLRKLLKLKRMKHIKHLHSKLIFIVNPLNRFGK